MSSSYKSPAGIKLRTSGYDTFMGLDVSRDTAALDTGEQQHLSQCENGFCDWRGQVCRDAGADFVQGLRPVEEICFYSSEKVVYAERAGDGINLVSEDDHTKLTAFPLSSVVTSAVFNKKAIFFASGEAVQRYDGTNYTVNTSPALAALQPSFGVAVARRLAVSGIRGRETEIHLSRVDDDGIFPEDEALDSTNVLRAGYIDIGNQLGTSEIITGLAKFEQSRLAVFTNDRVLIYQIDANINLWALDDRASINIGCLSHSTIQRAGTDILFCSRSGVHSLRRSVENGLTIEGASLSDKVDILYRELLASVKDPKQIKAVYDQDLGQYHIFFPQSGGIISKRLTLTLRSGELGPSWSTGEFLNARSGAFLGGRLVYGTSGGIYNVRKIEDEAQVHPEMVITTPMLWHGSFVDTKSVQSILLQATGTGDAKLEIIDDEGNTLASQDFQISESPDDNSFQNVPLSRQYERPLSVRYRGAQYRLTVAGKGLCRIIGFGVLIRK